MSDNMTWEEAVTWLRDHPDMHELVRACYYDDPLLEAAKRFYAEAEWQAHRALLPSPGKALDVGAGRGIASYALARDGWKVTSIEPDPSEVVGAGAIRSLAGETGLAIDVIECYAENISVPDDYFDAVICRQALHHAHDLGALCKEMARVLKPGGIFIASREHVIDNRETDLQLFLDGHPLHHLYGGENAYLLREYRDAIEQAGITVTHILNPWASEINTFPLTKMDIKREVSGRYRFPFPCLIPDGIITWLGQRLSTPGRLYTFSGVKN